MFTDQPVLTISNPIPASLLFVCPTPVPINDKVDRVIAQLPVDVPFIQPKHVAPLLGITDNAFCGYCRRHTKMKAWKGSYRFMTDDGQHMSILADVVKLVIWSGRKLPAELKSTAMRVH
jgi:hypothetical protein